MRKQSFRNYILIGNRTQDTSPTGIRERIGILFPGLLFTFWARYGLLSNAHVLLALCDEMTDLDRIEK
jgi:hypothetical protein